MPVSLSDRIGSHLTRKPHALCQTCMWIDTLSDADRAAMDQWFTEGRSRRGFWIIASSDPDNPLPVSDSAFKNHMVHHKGADGP